MVDVVRDDGRFLDARFGAAVGHLWAAGIAAHLGRVFEVGIVEMEVADGDVLDGRAILSGHDDAALRTAEDILDADVPHVAELGVFLDVLLHVEVDGAVDAVFGHRGAGDVGEEHVFDGALLPHDDGDHAVTVDDGAVAEDDVADVVVGLGTEGECAAVRLDGAVGDVDVLRGAPVFHRLQDDGVVAAVQAAVGDEDVAAAVDVDAVGVGAVEVVVDDDAVDAQVVAALRMHGPAGAVLNGNAGERNVLGVADLHQWADALDLSSVEESAAGGSQKAGPLPSITPMPLIATFSTSFMTMRW